jgi:hypothetical protein
MGFRINYIAAKCSAEDMARLFMLDLGATSDEQLHDGDWLAHIKTSGWTVLWIEDETFISKNRKMISKASEFCDVIACDVNETVMWSAAEYFKDGELVWKLTHSGESNITDLYEEGSVPERVSLLKAEALKSLEEEGDDAPDYMFDVPLDAAADFIKFRHDEVLKGDDVETFYAVSRPHKQGFFESFFGLKK